MHLNATILPGIVAAIIGLAVLLAFAQRVRRLGATWPRRRRIVNGAVFILLALVWAAGVYAWLIEPRMLVVRLVEVVSEHWAGAPLTIGVIADTHVPGPHMDAARVARVVDALNRHEPDIVVLLGDDPLAALALGDLLAAVRERPDATICIDREGAVPHPVYLPAALLHDFAPPRQGDAADRGLRSLLEARTDVLRVHTEAPEPIDADTRDDLAALGTRMRDLGLV